MGIGIRPGSLCSKEVIRPQFLSPSLATFLCVGLFLREGSSHMEASGSPATEILFLPAQRSQWEESFSLPILPEKVLELASIGVASSCAHLQTKRCGWGDIIWDLDCAHLGLGGRANSIQTSQADIRGRIVPQRRMRGVWVLVLLLKRLGMMLDRQNKNCPGSLWLNHC